VKPLLGLDISSDRVRAVSVKRWLGTPQKRFEIRWDVNDPAPGIALLRETFGSVGGIGIAIGLELLSLKHIALPPVPTDERRRMILLEPDRFFPSRVPLAVSVSGKSDLVFAAELGLVENLIAALEQWAPVESMEASPVSFTRALGKGGAFSGVFDLPAGRGERGSVTIESGALVSARRAFGEQEGERSRPAPPVAEVPTEFLAAFGAALGADGRSEDMLVTPAQSGAMARRRRSRLIVWSAAAVLAFLLLAFSYDRARARYLDRIETALAQLAPEADSATRARGRVMDRQRAAQMVDEVRASRADPMKVLSILARRLPHDAYVTSVRVAADQWEIDGTAGNASAIIPALDAEKEIENVRLRSATSRFRDAGKTRESFAIGFRARNDR